MSEGNIDKVMGVIIISSVLGITGVITSGSGGIYFYEKYGFGELKIETIGANIKI